MGFADTPFLRAPVGADAHRWRTFRGERTLVVAARTLTSTIRILEVLPALLRDDPRITVIFAHDPGSAFNNGSLDLLHDSGCRIMPWGQLAHIDPDLILSASEYIDLPAGHCPVLVLPHGVGFQKYVPDSRAPGSRLSGVAPDELLEAGRAWMALSHPEQERQLVAAHPKSAGRTLVVGDPCLDELLVSEGGRDAYRRSLGVRPGQRLVVASSTWGPTSLIGQMPMLPAQLLGELPWDAYRVALILHPNVWSAHGSWHIRALQAAALDAGLLLIPPVHDWRPALVASDAVIGDHGSVTLYGAALGRPVALAAYGNEAVPGTAGAELAEVAPRLDQESGLLTQIDDVVRTHEGRSDQYATVAARAFARPGTALAHLREALYGLLRLPQPPTSAPRAQALAAPADPSTQVTSWMVRTRLGDTPSAPDSFTVDVCRFPASVAPEPYERERLFWHLAVRPDEERDRGLTESASVLLSATPATDPAATQHWIDTALSRWPGSLMAAGPTARGPALVGLRTGDTIEVTAADSPATDPALAASAVYTCLRAALPPHTTRVTLRLDGTATAASRLTLLRLSN